MSGQAVNIMSIEHPKYSTGNKQSINPSALLRRSEPGYQHPTWEDVRALKEISGETGGDLARRVDVDPRQWRRWTAPPNANNSGSIPYAAWRLLLLELNIVQH